MKNIGHKMQHIIKLTFLQKIGYFWFRLFDPSGYLFYLLRGRSKPTRMAFYVFYAFGFFGISYFLFNIFLVNYLYEYNASIAMFLGKALFVAVFATSLILPFYELIYVIDIEDLKNIKKRIVAAKRQWWRLRNMRFYTRSILYSLIWFIGVQVIYWQAIIYFGELHNITFLPNGGVVRFSSASEMETFSNLFLTFLYDCISIWSIVVMLVVLFFEYRIYKLKKAHV